MTLSKPPILVTGSNRSGTSWVGTMLCLQGDVAYIHEPFNSSVFPDKLVPPPPGQYTYVSATNEAHYLEPMRRVLAFKAPLARQIIQARSAKQVGLVARDDFQQWKGRIKRARPLIKDPIAVFAAPWLHERLGCQVAVMIRHPAGHVSSSARLGWTYQFAYMASQPELMDDLLAPLADEVRDYGRTERPPFDQAILLWRCVYTAVAAYQQRYPAWQFVKYEELAREPVDGFKTLYDVFDIGWDDTVAAKISSFTQEGNPGERPVSEFHSVARDSKAASETWRERLTPEEITTIRRAVEDVSDHFYGAEEW